MLAEADPYIRAINPELTAMFVDQNKAGFDNALKYFKSDAYKSEVPSTIYKPVDFNFMEV
jgi:hypothetical protein